MRSFILHSIDIDTDSGRATNLAHGHREREKEKEIKTTNPDSMTKLSIEIDGFVRKQCAD